MSSDLTSIYSQLNLKVAKHGDDSIYEFERFRLDAARRMLYENNQPLQLAPKVVETLVALVRQRGEIISKEKLMSEVWAGSFVEDSNLTQNIYLLRKTLGKAADGRDLIETFRRRGYRFTGEIKENRVAGANEFKPREQNGDAIAVINENIHFIDSPDNFFEAANGDETRETVETGAANFQKPAETSAKRTNAPTFKHIKRYSAVAAAAVLLFLLTIFAAPRLFRSETSNAQNQSAAAPNVKNTRLTPDINVSFASFTPDGNYLVYTLQEKGKNSVWLKDLRSGGATQIQPPSSEDYANVTVTRGNFLYYVTHRPNAPNGTLLRVPLAGGGEQLIAGDLTSPFTLSPDEKQVAFVNSRWQLVAADAEQKSELRVLAARDEQTGWFESWSSRLSWSPDGASIVICGGRKTTDGKSVRELIEISVKDGAEIIIPTPADWNYLDDAVWLSDKSGLLVTARETAASPFQIWRVAYPNGDVRRITNDTNDYADLNVAPDSRRLVGIKNFGNWNLWLAPLEDVSKAKQITFGSAAQDGVWGMTFAPNNQIIYTSPRGGNYDLWQTNANGGEQKQLTKNAGDWNGKPQITADNRYVVFTSARSGAKQIWRMDADGGNPKQLTEELWADEASLSASGEFVYFTAKADGKTFISKISINGGEAMRISPAPHDFFQPVVSPDGKLIFCRFYDAASNAPWKSGVINAETGELLKVFDFIHGTARWTADSKTIIYSLGTENLWQISIAENSKPQQFTDFESGVIRTFAVSPDFKQIALSRGNPTNEAVLLENF